MQSLQKFKHKFTKLLTSETAQFFSNFFSFFINYLRVIYIYSPKLEHRLIYFNPLTAWLIAPSI